MTFDGQKIIVNVDSDKYGRSYLDFCLDVKLNDNANVGSIGNEITSIVTVTDDPYVENSTVELQNSVTMTTYGLELTSLGEASSDGTTPALTGAKYEIYTDSGLTADSKIGDFTVENADGTVTFTGVPAGTVYLKQVRAPAGYQLIKETIEVSITGDGSIDTDNDEYYEVITTNSAMWYLPLTGGKGTIIYTMIGLIVIILSSLAIIKYKKNLNLNKN